MRWFFFSKVLLESRILLNYIEIFLSYSNFSAGWTGFLIQVALISSKIIYRILQRAINIEELIRSQTVGKITQKNEIFKVVNPYFNPYIIPAFFDLVYKKKIDLWSKFENSISKTVGYPHFCGANISNRGSPFYKQFRLYKE